MFGKMIAGALKGPAPAPDMDGFKDTAPSWGELATLLASKQTGMFVCVYGTCAAAAVTFLSWSCVLCLPVSPVHHHPNHINGAEEERQLPELRAKGRGPTSSKAELRLFDAPDGYKPRVTLYRDTAAWCVAAFAPPVCVRVFVRCAQRGR